MSTKTFVRIETDLHQILTKMFTRQQQNLTYDFNESSSPAKYIRSALWSADRHVRHRGTNFTEGDNLEMLTECMDAAEKEVYTLANKLADWDTVKRQNEQLEEII